jgi:ABC-type phosphate/phosphonate transport system substrate-binding protein
MFWLALILLSLLVSTASAGDPAPKVIRIGIVKSIFRDIPAPIVKTLSIPFNSLMYQQTGMKAELSTNADALELGELLDAGKVDLAVFHGFEFAWAQEKFPKLKPLMIAVNEQRYMTVQLITSKESEVSQFSDMKGKTVGLPNRSREHCHLYLERHCEKSGAAPGQFFTKVVKHSNAEDALDDVVRGDVDGVIVDSLTLECYSVIKAACLDRLKVVEKSELFPAGVIVYREGTLDDATLEQFRKGMLNANQTPKGRALMSLWKLTAFEPVPADYQQVLENIRKTYPAPAAVAVKTTQTGKAAGQE